MALALIDFITPIVTFGNLLMQNAARLSHVGDGVVLMVPDGQQLGRYTNLPTGTTLTSFQQAVSGINTKVSGTNAQLAAATSALQAQDLMNVQAVIVAGEALLKATPHTVAALLKTYIAAIQKSAPYDAITLLLALANSMPITQITEQFSRASTATYVTTLGTVSSVAANVLRYDAGAPPSMSPDPFVANRQPLALVEGATINLCRNSETVAGTGWTNTGLTVTANAGVSPDGLTTATRVVGNGVAYTKVNTGVSMVVGDVYTFTTYAKAGAYSNIKLSATGEGSATFDLAASAVYSALPSKMQALGNGWFRLATTFTKTNTSDGFWIGMF